MARKIRLILDFSQDLNECVKAQYPNTTSFRIVRKSLDARNANKGKRPRYNYHLELFFNQETCISQKDQFPQIEKIETTPIIIGSGPAGLFCALRLADYGIPSIILEKGDPVEERSKKIAKFWRFGRLDTESNVCFGEGGAGLFSDGKLMTRIKSPYLQYFLDRLVDFGAPQEIAYLSGAHLGTNKIRKIIINIRKYLQERGCKIFYNSLVNQLIIEPNSGRIKGVKLRSGKKYYSSNVILATGHSAREIYQHLNELNVSMEAKDFAIGVRIEHPREIIDEIQLGNFANCHLLGAASYRLSYSDNKSARGTYSFCMCPGGHIISSAPEADGLVTNGMSNYKRNSSWSNSALVVTTRAGVDFPGADPMAGLQLQREIEHQAWIQSIKYASGKELPAQLLTEFLSNKFNKNRLLNSSSPSGVFNCFCKSILPDFVVESLLLAIQKFDQKMKGFINDRAIIVAPETRTSAPVKIVRDQKSKMSISIEGLYPCGEGAGYTGGITSSAIDGIEVAMAILNEYIS